MDEESATLEELIEACWREIDDRMLDAGCAALHQLVARARIAEAESRK